MHIQRLTPQHSSAYHTLRLAGLAEQGLAFGASPLEEAQLSAEQQATRLENTARQAVFGAFIGDDLLAVVGFARETLQKLSHKGLVWGMYCAPQARGQGVAKALLQTLCAHARAQDGVRQLNLCVNVEQEAAIRLYQGLGFQIFGREEDSICMDGRMYAEFHMVLKL